MYRVKRGQTIADVPVGQWGYWKGVSGNGYAFVTPHVDVLIELYPLSEHWIISVEIHSPFKTAKSTTAPVGIHPATLRKMGMGLLKEYVTEKKIELQEIEVLLT